MKKGLAINIAIAILLLFVSHSYAQTAGTLTMTYNQPQPTSPSLNQGVKNVYAVWIENSTGTFIKTKYRFTSTSTDDHLPTWASKCGCTSTSVATGTACNTTDAVSAATRTATTSPTAFGSKNVTWDGKNVVGATNGTNVVDGSYKVWVESSWNDGSNNIHNEINSFAFTKSNVITHITYNGDTYLNTIVIDWVPTALGLNDIINSEPAVTIYPVPSTGIFNIDLKNEVNDIKVYNLLGQTVYSKKFENNNATTTKQIDLSGLSDGNYVFSLTNENGISNYEVILKK
ncbi:MAG: T9SS type A sorting domain-containing protein [Flavobacterium sp.]|uniref:T9SS type A sorting domain-containing protein n=1 Tax=Flavobacterium sp. TaxID=239 RepID=UPI00326378FE